MYVRTTEPHDELHTTANLDRSESIDEERERVDVERSTEQYEDETPHDEANFKRCRDGEHLHTNVQEHNRLCTG